MKVPAVMRTAWESQRLARIVVYTSLVFYVLLFSVAISQVATGWITDFVGSDDPMLRLGDRVTISAHTFLGAGAAIFAAIGWNSAIVRRHSQSLREAVGLYEVISLAYICILVISICVSLATIL